MDHIGFIAAESSRRTTSAEDTDHAAEKDRGSVAHRPVPYSATHFHLRGSFALAWEQAERLTVNVSLED